MNTLSDLRSTLDEHAELIPDGEVVVRTAAVHHRVSVVRRRRRAVGAGVLSLALLVGGAASLANRGHHDALPAAPTVLGVKAPDTITSLGYTYRTDGSSETISGQGSIDIDQSTEPRLISWTTDQRAIVKLKLPDGEYWTSTASDFHDFVVIPPGDGGTLKVSTTAGRVGLASYDVTDPARGALGGDLGDFRREVAGLRLDGGLITHARNLSAWSRLLGRTGMVKVSVLCAGAPPGSLVHVSLAGSELTGGCDTSSFDPGSNVIGSTSTGPLGRFGRFRVWVSGPHSSRPLVIGPHDDRVELGVGLYGPEDSTQVGGGPMDRTIEYGGHTWRLAETRESNGSPLRFRIDVENPAIVQVGMRLPSSKPTYLHLLASGMPLQQTGFSGKGGGTTGPYWAPAGARVRVTRSTPGAFGVGIYTRAD
jgi:hypothetical protein